MTHETEPPSPLVAFVPRSIRVALADVSRVVPFEDVRPGAVILADIAGFTPLAEALAREGSRGAEELTALLNDVLGALVSRIEADGGDILKFAGDAILARWSDAPLVDSARRATACAHALHAVAARASSAHGLALGLSVGVGAGQVRLLVVGGEASRWESLPLGPALSQVAFAAREARHGETILSADAFSLLGDSTKGSPRPSGNVLLRSPPPSPPVAPTAPEPSATLELLGRFVAPAVRQRLDAQIEWASELRRVTAIFLHLSTAEDEPLDRVDDAFVALCRVIGDAGGTVDKLTVDEKGVTAVAALGLPPGAHGDDPVRAVRASLELHESLTRLDWTPRIGVATGRVFCGVVGNSHRREYTVIGDTVNVAARLMQRARGQVLCHESTVQACRHALAFGPLSRLRVDGKADELRAAVPLDGRGPTRDEHADPVRAAELDALREGLDTLARGEGGVWLVEGAAGQGKSRLLGRILSEATAIGVDVLAGSADSSDRGAPYRAWRGVVTTLLGLAGVSDVATRTTRLLERLQGDSYATARSPLLAELLGVSLPDNALTATLAGEVRAFNTQDLLVHLLRSASTSGRPLLIALDDVHWLDSASLGLLREVTRQLPAVLLLLCGRPSGDGGAAALSGLEPTRRIALGSLDLAGTTLLLSRVLGAVPDALLAESVHRRAEGHPFFTAELARSLVESDELEIAASGARLRSPDGDVPMPETVQGAILSRLDRLDPVAQLVAKVASVIGRSYSWRLLHTVHPVDGHRPELRRRCDELALASLTELEAPEPEPAWRFIHETTREVAYDLLLFAQRRQLHEAVATALEHAAGRPPNASLAFHWERAERPDRALRYLEAFADEALREGAYVEAERVFARLLATPGVPSSAVSADRRAHWELQHGEALLGLGHLEASRAALERAVSLLGFAVPRGPVALAGALTAGLAAQLVKRTLRLNLREPASGTVETHRKAARASLRIIETCFFLAGPVETTHAALRALQIAEAAGPSPELARAYALFGWILSMVPLFSAADHYLTLASALVERPDCAEARQPVLFFTGFTRTATGRWEEARAALTEAIDLAHSRGDKRRWIESVCGICSPLHYQGEFEARVELGKGVLYAAARRQGDRQAEAWGILDQLESLLPLGDLDRIAPLLDELEPYLGRPIGRSEQVWANGLLALGRLLQGRTDEALRAAIRTTDAAAAMDPVAVYVYEGHASAVEVLIQLHKATLADGTLARELDRAYHQLSRYARVFPYARARTRSCEARILALRGKRRAVAVARRAVTDAVAIRMPLEEAIARATLGTLTGDGAELARARELLSRLGARAWERLLGSLR